MCTYLLQNGALWDFLTDAMWYNRCIVTQLTHVYIRHKPCLRESNWQLKHCVRINNTTASTSWMQVVCINHTLAMCSERSMFWYKKNTNVFNTLRPRKCMNFWSLFLRFQLSIFHHWFIKWLAAQATSHYLNQWWLIYWHIYASLGLNASKGCGVVRRSYLILLQKQKSTDGEMPLSRP